MRAGTTSASTATAPAAPSMTGLISIASSRSPSATARRLQAPAAGRRSAEAASGCCQRGLASTRPRLLCASLRSIASRVTGIGPDAHVAQRLGVDAAEAAQQHQSHAGRSADAGDRLQRRRHHRLHDRAAAVPSVAYAARKAAASRRLVRTRPSSLLCATPSATPFNTTGQPTRVRGGERRHRLLRTRRCPRPARRTRASSRRLSGSVSVRCGSGGAAAVGTRGQRGGQRRQHRADRFQHDVGFGEHVHAARFVPVRVRRPACRRARRSAAACRMPRAHRPARRGSGRPATGSSNAPAPARHRTPGSFASSDGTSPARRMPPKMPRSSGLPMRENMRWLSMRRCVSGDSGASGTPSAAQRSASNDAPAPEVDIAPRPPGRRP